MVLYPKRKKKIKASSLNNEKQKITEAINNRFKELEKLEISKKLQKDKVDVTLPARERPNAVSYTHLTLPTNDQV